MESSSDRIQVCVRVRPPFVDEASPVVHVLDTKSVAITDPMKPTGPRNPSIFSYDHVFSGTDTNDTVYLAVGPSMVSSVLLGYNACMFAYGQTGSGKTYTMLGTADNSDVHGIIPLLLNDLFYKLSLDTRPTDTTSVAMTYCELYLDKMYCLLSRDDPFVNVRDTPTGPMVCGAHTLYGDCPEVFLEAIHNGSKNRVTSSTRCNERSSRSHAICTLNVTRTRIHTDTGKAVRTTSQVHLVDLAGSESASKAQTSGLSLREGTAIGQSLLTLGKVIHQLTKMESHISYRESTLTYLLKTAIGGNSRTVMLATISPSQSNFYESLSTLKYASEAKKVRNVAVINETTERAEPSKLKDEINRLYSEVESLKLSRWLAPTGTLAVIQRVTLVGLGSNDALVYPIVAGNTFVILPQDVEVTWSGSHAVVLVPDGVTVSCTGTTYSSNQSFPWYHDQLITIGDSLQFRIQGGESAPMCTSSLLECPNESMVAWSTTSSRIPSPETVIQPSILNEHLHHPCYAKILEIAGISKESLPTTPADHGVSIVVNVDATSENELIDVFVDGILVLSPRAALEHVMRFVADTQQARVRAVQAEVQGLNLQHQTLVQQEQKSQEHIRKEVERTKSKNRELMQEIVNLKKSLKEVQHHGSELEVRNSDLVRQLSSNQLQLVEAMQSTDHLKTVQRDMEKEILQIDVLRKEVEEAWQQRMTCESQSRHWENMYESLVEEAEALRHSEGAAKKDLKQLHFENESLREQLHKFTQSMSSDCAGCYSLRRKVSELEKNKEEQTDVLRAMSHNLSKMSEDLQSSKLRNKSVEFEVNALNMQIKDLQNRNNRANEERLALGVEADSLRQAYGQASDALRRLEHEKKVWEQEYANHKEELLKESEKKAQEKASARINQVTEAHHKQRKELLDSLQKERTHRENVSEKLDVVTLENVDLKRRLEQEKGKTKHLEGNVLSLQVQNRTLLQSLGKENAGAAVPSSHCTTTATSGGGGYHRTSSTGGINTTTAAYRRASMPVILTKKLSS
eukprot:PhF_6_TR42647/c0_g1_i1/m.64183